MAEGQVPTTSIPNNTSAGILPGYFTKPTDLGEVERGGEKERKKKKMRRRRRSRRRKRRRRQREKREG